MMVTSIVRIAIVLSFARSAIGVAQIPPNQILPGLALFVTVFVMALVWTTINDAAVQPYRRNDITLDQAYGRAEQPLRNFMLRQTPEKDIALFVSWGNLQQPDTEADARRDEGYSRRTGPPPLPLHPAARRLAVRYP